MVEKERVAYAQIDWHDFVVVETVDYQANEQGNFPPPTTPADVGARIIALERIESSNPDSSKIDYNSKLLMNRIIDDESRVEISCLSAVQNQVTEQSVVVDSSKDKNIDEVAMDEDSDEEKNKKTVPVKKDLPLPPNPEHVIIRKDYDPKAKHVQITNKQDTYFKSPLTGELIPASSMSEHMRISMLDPRWIEQKRKEKKEKEDQDEVLTGGFNIEENLKRLAEYRSDVFGSGADEALIGKKVGEEELNPDQTWDGQIEKLAKRSVQGVSVEEQIRAIHQSQGIVDESDKVPGLKGYGGPPPTHMPNPNMPPQGQISLSNYNIGSGPPGQMMGGPPPHMVAQHQPPPSYQPTSQFHEYEIPRVSAQLTDTVDQVNEPAQKRQKTEDQLIPEGQFLAQNGHNGPVKFNVQIPNMPDKPEWNLKGQLIPFSMALTETVSSIKNKLVEYLNMAIAKQKLQYDGMFVKDTNNLAFYNLPNNATIYLQMKERGGRKK